MRAKKVDRGHAEIAAHIRSIGWSVFDSSGIGRGYADLTVSRLGHTALVEVKHGKKEPNELQRKFRDGWKGAYFVVRSPEDAEQQLARWLELLAVEAIEWVRRSMEAAK